MGSIISTLFGGNQNQNQSSGQNTYSSTNQAYPFLQGALGGTVGTGAGAGSQLANLLGLNGTPAQTQGFNNFKNSTGYQFGLNQGDQSITGNAATQGLLNSGSTLKALNTYGQNYANTQYGNYTGMLQGLLGSGISAGGVLGGAGNTSQGQGTNESSGSGSGSTGNAGGWLGSLINKGGGAGAGSSAASDAAAALAGAW